MNQKLSLLLLKGLTIIIIFIGIFLRWVDLDKKVYWNDEVFTSLRISGYTEKELKNNIYNGSILSKQEILMYQKPNSEKTVLGTVKGLALEEPQLPPFYFIIARIWIKLFGSSVAIIRSLSAIFGTLAIFCIY